MTAEEILTNLYEKYSNGNEWDLALDNIKKYANQRVIDELEKLLADEGSEWVDDIQGYEGGDFIVYSRDLRDRIKELKQ